MQYTFVLALGRQRCGTISLTTTYEPRTRLSDSDHPTAPPWYRFKTRSSATADIAQVITTFKVVGRHWFLYQSKARMRFLIDHPRSGVVYNFCRFCLSLCVSVCLLDDNFQKALICTSGISPGNTGQVGIWRSSGQGQGHGSRKHLKCLFPLCETSIAHNSGSIKDRAIRFVCSMKFSLKI